ncbi:MAG: hypothetical protein IJM51_08145 [Clostridia bacterium]|nr:hypothetical protein [Clostridia bacterium]
MSDISKINRNYKDRLFKFIFGNPDKKEWTLSLYNAMNNSSYTDPDAISLNTIEDAVYMGMKNDVSFLIADTLNLYEHQSGYNPNMPMRFLIYAGMIYDKYTETTEEYHRFSSKQQSAPTPKCVCFYNGTREMGDRVILKLSDAFASGVEPDIEVKVTMVNINYGHNKELLKVCEPLRDYSYFVHEARINRKSAGSLTKAIDIAIEKLSDDSLIKPFLIANRAEVKNMFITEYDEEKAFAEQKAEGRAEGIAIGEAKGKMDAFIGLVKDGLLTVSQAAEKVNMTVPEFEAAMQGV